MNNGNKVLIYSSPPRLFRTTYIGYLYEISQVFPTILISEKLDPASERILHDKTLFPKLEKIILIDQYLRKRHSLWRSHKKYSVIAKEIIKETKPKFVIADSLINPLEKYLLRYGHIYGSLNVAFQAGFQLPYLGLDTLRQHLQWRDFGTNVKYNILIRNLKLYLLKLKEHFIEILDYWIYPLILGLHPFSHKSLFKFGVDSWVREFDYVVVFSQKEVQLEKLLGRKDDQIIILSHPLERKSRIIFEKAYKISPFWEKPSHDSKTAVIMLSASTFAHKRNNHALIPTDEYMMMRIKTIKLISAVLNDWKIYIKPHPVTDKHFVDSLKNYFQTSEKIEIVDPKDSADKYIEASFLIIGFPPPSTTLYTATLQNKFKTVLYLDFFHELLGDALDEYPGIKYIDSYDGLSKTLHQLKAKNYQSIEQISSLKDPKSAATIISEISNKIGMDR